MVEIHKPVVSEKETHAYQNGSNGSGSLGVEYVVSTQPDAPQFSSNGTSYKPRTELNIRETTIMQHLQTKGEEGASSAELANLFPGDHTMGPRMVQNVVAMAGHISRHHSGNVPAELQGMTVRHIEGGKYGLVPLEENPKI